MPDIEPSAANNYQVSPTLTFSRERWNAVMASIAARLAARELLEASFEALIAEGTQAALDLIQVNVGPQLETLTQQIATLEEQLEDIIGAGTAPNALMLGGQLPSFYLALANATGTLPVSQVTGVDALIAAAVASLVNAAPSQLDTLKELSDALGGDQAFAATMAAALGNRLRFDAAQVLNGGQKSQALANLGATASGIAILQALDTAEQRTALQIDRFNRPRNRIVNPSMRQSQERGTASVDYAASGGVPIDQWLVFLSSTPGGTLRAQQVVAATPGGSTHRLRLSVQALDNAIAAGEFYSINQNIEGCSLADARFGSAAAKQIIVRFGVRSSVAGTFTIAVRNAAADRSYLTSFTIAAGEVGTDVVKAVTVPGDTSGAWISDNGVGAQLSIALACGSSFQGAAGWQAGNKLALPAQVNFMSTAGATFELFDAGLYVDHDATGILPPWTLPDFDEELRLCQRYWESGEMYLGGYAGSTHGEYGSIGFKATKRVPPSLSYSISSIANLSVFDVRGPTFQGLFVYGQPTGAGGFYGIGSWYANSRL